MCTYTHTYICVYTDVTISFTDVKDEGEKMKRVKKVIRRLKTKVEMVRRKRLQ